MTIDLIPDATDNANADKNARNQAAFLDIQQAVAERFRYAAAVHIPVAWQVSAYVTMACRAFFKESPDVTHLNSWLSYLIPALAGAATLVLTKNAIEDVWLRPASMRALIQAKKSEADVTRANVDVRVFDEESNRMSGESDVHYVISCPGTPGSIGFSEGEASEIEQNEGSHSSYEPHFQGVKFHTVSSESSLLAPLLPPAVNYTLVAQMVDREVGQHAAYKASVMMLGATLWLMSLHLSDDVTRAFDVGHDDTLGGLFSIGAQVLFYFLSGVLLPVVMQALGIKLADHWSLVTGVTLASLVGGQAAMAAVDSQPYVAILVSGVAASMVAAGTITLDHHYRGQPSAIFNRGLNAIGAAIGQVVTCGVGTGRQGCPRAQSAM